MRTVSGNATDRTGAKVNDIDPGKPIDPVVVRAGDFDHGLAKYLHNAYYEAETGTTRLPPWILDMPGMSGRGYRILINHLISAMGVPAYLEIGCHAGSTACAAICGNRLAATCIDNWSEFGGPEFEFFEHVDACLSPEIDFRFIESDFREVEFAGLGPFNVYLFDGPHEENDQYDGITMAQPALAASHILIVDD
jgi:hypothetical protein